MHRGLFVLCAGAIVLSGAIAVGQVSEKEGEQKEQDRSKLERELSDLEAQRAKLNMRIGELRRQIGGRAGRISGSETPSGTKFLFAAPRPNGRFRFGGDGSDLKELTPEQRKQVEDALEAARRALESARKDLPPGYVLPAIPDLQGLMNRSPRVYVGPNAKAFRFDTSVGPEFRAQIQKDMERMRSELQNQSRVWKGTTPGPNAFRFETSPRAPGDSSPEIRAELKRLRDELQQLREEVKRLRDKPDSKFQ